jgi:DNA-binding NarL/FixJ family response regulator
MIGTMDSLPASVIVIESHPIMRAALCTAIAEEPDLQVVEVDASDPNNLAISLMEDIYFLPRNIDIILLTLGNPGLKEMEALKSLRASLPEVPILALTSNEVPGQEQSALAAGAQVVLTKSASRNEIIHALREMRRKNSNSSHPKIQEQEANENTFDQNNQFASAKSEPGGPLAHLQESK